MRESSPYPHLARKGPGRGPEHTAFWFAPNVGIVKLQIEDQFYTELKSYK